MLKSLNISLGQLSVSSVHAFYLKVYRGVLVCAIGGVAAFWLSEHYAAPVMLLALLLGLTLNFLYKDECMKHGIDWVARDVLRIGVGLLGLRILFTDIITEGVTGPLIVAAAMIVTFIAGAVIAKMMKLSAPFARLSAGSVAVCGVSAAIAISAVLPKRKNSDNELAVVIISVTALSTLAMIIYPIVAAQLSLGDHDAGIFIGGSIHDVAQVVGAGYSISEDAGDTATYIKLMRVALLLPIVLLIGIASRGDFESTNKPPLLPGFLIGFLILATLNSLGVIPIEVSSFGNHLSRAFLVLSIFAIGAKTRLGELFKVGVKPLLLVCCETIVMAVIVIAGLLLV